VTEDYSYGEAELFRKDYYSSEYVVADIEKLTVWESFDS
jgi:hypothetical protein